MNPRLIVFEGGATARWRRGFTLIELLVVIASPAAAENGASLLGGVTRLGSTTISVASGSTLSGGFWDLNGGKLNFLNGAAATMNQWECKGVNRFSFKLGPAGFTKLTPGTLYLTSTADNHTWIADMADYTGGPGIITLVDFGSDAGGMDNTKFQTSTLIVTNAPLGYTANLQYNDATEAVELNVTEAPGYFTAYWDNDGTTPGFGTASGTWASPTTGNSSQGWSLDTNGTVVPVDVTTGLKSPVNFGCDATGLGLEAGTVMVSGNVTNGGMTFASGSGAIVLSNGIITLPAAGTITINAANTITNSITSDLVADTSLTKAGGGTLLLSGAKTYTGKTTVSGGMLVVDNAASLGGTSSNTAVANGATLHIVGGISIAEPLSLTGSGVSFYPDPQGALLSTGTNTVTGLVSLSSGARLATEGTDTLTFTGGITNANNSTLVGAFAINHNPINAGTGGINFAGDGAQPPPVTGKTIQLNAAGNTWSDATLYFAAIVRLGVDNAMPTGATVSFGFLNDDLGRSTLDLNGHNQTVASIETHSSALSASGTTLSITGGGTLTVNQSAASKTFTGIISDGATPTALTKAGTGTLILSGINTYTGNTTVSAGTLVLGNDAAINLTSGLSIAAGATLDTTPLTVPLPFTIPITGSGTGTNVGTTAAAIIGVSEYPHDLGARHITLNYDGSHPALYLAGGTLNLNDNPFTINGSVLANGVYTIIAQSDTPDITGSVAASTVNGTALAGRTGTVSLAGNTVVLTVTGAGPVGPATLTNSVSGGVLSLSWPAGQGWRLQQQTNSLSLGLSTNWVYVTDGSVNSTNITVDTTKPTVFYRLRYP